MLASPALRCSPVLWVVAGILTGCAGDPAAGAGASLDAVMATLTFARATDGVTRGFDLDDRTSEPGDSRGCSQGDWLGEDGSEGVDNQLARLLPVLDDTEARALGPIIQGAVNDGQILLVTSFFGLDDTWNDDSVEVWIRRGVGFPDMGNDGIIAPGQTFDVDPDVASSVVLDAAIVEGELVARGFDIEIPVDIFSAHFVISVQDAGLRFFFDEDGWHGYFGGAFPYQPVVDGLLAADIDQALKDLLPSVFEGFSDIDGPDGDCSAMSVTLDFDARRSFFFDE